MFPQALRDVMDCFFQWLWTHMSRNAKTIFNQRTWHQGLTRLYLSWSWDSWSKKRRVTIRSPITSIIEHNTWEILHNFYLRFVFKWTLDLLFKKGSDSILFHTLFFYSFCLVKHTKLKSWYRQNSHEMFFVTQ